MTARWVACLTLAAAACTHAQAPRVRMAGEIAALGGIAGLMMSTAATAATDGARPFIVAFSVISAAGIVSYAIGELGDPAFAPQAETVEQTHRRWARILTERAAGAAREGKCARVRRLEVRVRRYDAEIHDFVFLRDPEILRCLQSPAWDRRFVLATRRGKAGPTARRAPRSVRRPAGGRSGRAGWRRSRRRSRRRPSA